MDGESRSSRRDQLREGLLSMAIRLCSCTPLREFSSAGTGTTACLSIPFGGPITSLTYKAERCSDEEETDSLVATRALVQFPDTRSLPPCTYTDVDIDMYTYTDQHVVGSDRDIHRY